MNGPVICVPICLENVVPILGLSKTGAILDFFCRTQLFRMRLWLKWMQSIRLFFWKFETKHKKFRTGPNFRYTPYLTHMNIYPGRIQRGRWGRAEGRFWSALLLRLPWGASGATRTNSTESNTWEGGETAWTWEYTHFQVSINAHGGSIGHDWRRCQHHCAGDFRSGFEKSASL